jgi:hypothetical protein
MKLTLVVVVTRSTALSGNETDAGELSASVALGGCVLAALQEARSTAADSSTVGSVAGLRILERWKRHSAYCGRGKMFWMLDLRSRRHSSGSRPGRDTGIAWRRCSQLPGQWRRHRGQ